jgi:hypothetical protein
MRKPKKHECDIYVRSQPQYQVEEFTETLLEGSQGQEGPDESSISTSTAYQLSESKPMVINHRRIAQRMHRTLAYKLAEATKLRFGCPDRDGANLKAVRKHIFDQIQELGLNNSDAARAIDRAVELVFVPTDEEIFAAGIPRCMEANRRLRLYRYGEARTWWERFKFWANPTKCLSRRR